MSPSAFRIFAGSVAAVAAFVLLITQVTEPDSQVATPPAPELEPIPASSPQPTPAPSPEEQEPPAPPTEEQPSGVVIYSHDFSSPDGGVLAGQPSDSGTNEFGTRSSLYSDSGSLLVRVESEIDTYVAGASTESVFFEGRDLTSLGDVSVEVDATPLDIGPGANWGLACRRERGVGSFYFAYVGDAGGHAGAGIIRQDFPGGEWTQLASTSALPAGVTLGPGETNRLRLDCIGSSIVLYVDGAEVLDASDESYPTGSVALFANPLPGSAANLEFDNLVIREPD